MTTVSQAEQIDDMVGHYTREELKEVCTAIHNQIMHGNGAADDVLSADMVELQDEYNLWAKALEKKMKYVSAET